MKCNRLTNHVIQKSILKILLFIDLTLKWDAKNLKCLLMHTSMWNEIYNIKHILSYWILQTLCCFLLKVEDELQTPSWNEEKKRKEKKLSPATLNSYFINEKKKKNFFSSLKVMVKI